MSDDKIVNLRGIDGTSPTLSDQEMVRGILEDSKEIGFVDIAIVGLTEEGSMAVYSTGGYERMFYLFHCGANITMESIAEEP